MYSDDSLTHSDERRSHKDHATDQQTAEQIQAINQSIQQLTHDLEANRSSDPIVEGLEADQSCVSLTGDSVTDQSNAVLAGSQNVSQGQALGDDELLLLHDGHQSYIPSNQQLSDSDIIDDIDTNMDKRKGENPTSSLVPQMDRSEEDSARSARLRVTDPSTHLTTDTQTEGASVQMGVSPLATWSSGDSQSPSHSETEGSHPMFHVTAAQFKKTPFLSVTPTDVWTNKQRKDRAKKRSDPFSGRSPPTKLGAESVDIPIGDSAIQDSSEGAPSVPRTYKPKIGVQEIRVHRTHSESSTDSDSDSKTVQFHVTINEDEVNILYNVEKSEYRTYGVRQSASPESESLATEALPDSININLTETKRIQTEDKYQSFISEKILLQKEDSIGAESGTVVSEKCFDSTYSLDVDRLVQGSDISRESSVERQTLDEDSNSSCYAELSKHVLPESMVDMDQLQSVSEQGDVDAESDHVHPSRNITDYDRTSISPVVSSSAVIPKSGCSELVSHTDSTDRSAHHGTMSLTSVTVSSPTGTVLSHDPDHQALIDNTALIPTNVLSTTAGTNLLDSEDNGSLSKYGDQPLSSSGFPSERLETDISTRDEGKQIDYQVADSVLHSESQFAYEVGEDHDSTYKDITDHSKDLKTEAGDVRQGADLITRDSDTVNVKKEIPHDKCIEDDHEQDIDANAKMNIIPGVAKQEQYYSQEGDFQYDTEKQLTVGPLHQTVASQKQSLMLAETVSPQSTEEPPVISLQEGLRMPIVQVTSENATSSEDHTDAAQTLSGKDPGSESQPRRTLTISEELNWQLGTSTSDGKPIVQKRDSDHTSPSSHDDDELMPKTFRQKIGIKDTMSLDDTALILMHTEYRVPRQKHHGTKDGSDSVMSDDSLSDSGLVTGADSASPEATDGNISEPFDQPATELYSVVKSPPSRKTSNSNLEDGETFVTSLTCEYRPVPLMYGYYGDRLNSPPSEFIVRDSFRVTSPLPFTETSIQYMDCTATSQQMPELAGPDRSSSKLGKATESNIQVDDEPNAELDVQTDITNQMITTISGDLYSLPDLVPSSSDLNRNMSTNEDTDTRSILNPDRDCLETLGMTPAIGIDSGLSDTSNKKGSHQKTIVHDTKEYTAGITPTSPIIGIVSPWQSSSVTVSHVDNTAASTAQVEDSVESSVPEMLGNGFEGVQHRQTHSRFSAQEDQIQNNNDSVIDTSQMVSYPGSDMPVKMLGSEMKQALSQDYQEQADVLVLSVRQPGKDDYIETEPDTSNTQGETRTVPVLSATTIEHDELKQAETIPLDQCVDDSRVMVSLEHVIPEINVLGKDHEDETLSSADQLQMSGDAAYHLPKQQKAVKGLHEFEDPKYDEDKFQSGKQEMFDTVDFTSNMEVEKIHDQGAQLPSSCKEAVSGSSEEEEILTTETVTYRMSDYNKRDISKAVSVGQQQINKAMDATTTPADEKTLKQHDKDDTVITETVTYRMSDYNKGDISKAVSVGQQQINKAMDATTTPADEKTLKQHDKDDTVITETVTYRMSDYNKGDISKAVSVGQQQINKAMDATTTPADEKTLKQHDEDDTVITETVVYTTHTVMDDDVGEDINRPAGVSKKLVDVHSETAAITTDKNTDSSNSDEENQTVITQTVTYITDENQKEGHVQPIRVQQQPFKSDSEKIAVSEIEIKKDDMVITESVTFTVDDSTSENIGKFVDDSQKQKLVDSKSELETVVSAETVDRNSDEENETVVSETVLYMTNDQNYKTLSKPVGEGTKSRVYENASDISTPSVDKDTLSGSSEEENEMMITETVTYITNADNSDEVNKSFDRQPPVTHHPGNMIDSAPVYTEASHENIEEDKMMNDKSKEEEMLTTETVTYMVSDYNKGDSEAVSVSQEQINKGTGLATSSANREAPSEYEDVKTVIRETIVYTTDAVMQGTPETSSLQLDHQNSVKPERSVLERIQKSNTENVPNLMEAFIQENQVDVFTIKDEPLKTFDEKEPVQKTSDNECTSESSLLVEHEHAVKAERSILDKIPKSSVANDPNLTEAFTPKKHVDILTITSEPLRAFDEETSNKTSVDGDETLISESVTYMVSGHTDEDFSKPESEIENNRGQHETLIIQTGKNKSKEPICIDHQHKKGASKHILVTTQVSGDSMIADENSEEEIEMVVTDTVTYIDKTKYGKEEQSSTKAVVQPDKHDSQYILEGPAVSADKTMLGDRSENESESVITETVTYYMDDGKGRELGSQKETIDSVDTSKVPADGEKMADSSEEENQTLITETVIYMEGNKNSDSSKAFDVTQNKERSDSGNVATDEEQSGDNTEEDNEHMITERYSYRASDEKDDFNKHHGTIQHQLNIHSQIVQETSTSTDKEMFSEVNEEYDNETVPETVVYMEEAVKRKETDKLLGLGQRRGSDVATVSTNRETVGESSEEENETVITESVTYTSGYGVSEGEKVDKSIEMTQKPMKIYPQHTLLTIATDIERQQQNKRETSNLGGNIKLPLGEALTLNVSEDIDSVNRRTPSESSEDEVEINESLVYIIGSGYNTCVQKQMKSDSEIAIDVGVRSEDEAVSDTQAGDKSDNEEMIFTETITICKDVGDAVIHDLLERTDLQVDQQHSVESKWTVLEMGEVSYLEESEEMEADAQPIRDGDISSEIETMTLNGKDDHTKLGSQIVLSVVDKGEYKHNDTQDSNRQFEDALKTAAEKREINSYDACERSSKEEDDYTKLGSPTVLSVVDEDEYKDTATPDSNRKSEDALETAVDKKEVCSSDAHEGPGKEEDDHTKLGSQTVLSVVDKDEYKDTATPDSNRKSEDALETAVDKKEVCSSDAHEGSGKEEDDHTKLGSQTVLSVVDKDEYKDTATPDSNRKSEDALETAVDKKEVCSSDAHEGSGKEEDDHTKLGSQTVLSVVDKDEYKDTATPDSNRKFEDALEIPVDKKEVCSSDAREGSGKEEDDHTKLGSQTVLSVVDKDVYKDTATPDSNRKFEDALEIPVDKKEVCSSDAHEGSGKEGDDHTKLGSQTVLSVVDKDEYKDTATPDSNRKFEDALKMTAEIREVSSSNTLEGSSKEEDDHTKLGSQTVLSVVDKDEYKDTATPDSNRKFEDALEIPVDKKEVCSSDAHEGSGKEGDDHTKLGSQTVLSVVDKDTDMSDSNRQFEDVLEKTAGKKEEVYSSVTHEGPGKEGDDHTKLGSQSVVDKSEYKDIGTPDRSRQQEFVGASAGDGWDKREASSSDANEGSSEEEMFFSETVVISRDGEKAHTEMGSETDMPILSTDKDTLSGGSEEENEMMITETVTYIANTDKSDEDNKSNTFLMQDQPPVTSEDIFLDAEMSDIDVEIKTKEPDHRLISELHPLGESFKDGVENVPNIQMGTIESQADKRQVLRPSEDPIALPEDQQPLTSKKTFSDLTLKTKEPKQKLTPKLYSLDDIETDPDMQVNTFQTPVKERQMLAPSEHSILLPEERPVILTFETKPSKSKKNKPVKKRLKPKPESGHENKVELISAESFVFSDEPGTSDLEQNAQQLPRKVMEDDENVKTTSEGDDAGIYKEMEDASQIFDLKHDGDEIVSTHTNILTKLISAENKNNSALNVSYDTPLSGRQEQIIGEANAEWNQEEIRAAQLLLLEGSSVDPVTPVEILPTDVQDQNAAEYSGTSKNITNMFSAEIEVPAEFASLPQNMDVRSDGHFIAQTAHGVGESSTTAVTTSAFVSPDANAATSTGVSSNNTVPGQSKLKEAAPTDKVTRENQSVVSSLDADNDETTNVTTSWIQGSKSGMSISLERPGASVHDAELYHSILPSKLITLEKDPQAVSYLVKCDTVQESDSTLYKSGDYDYKHPSQFASIEHQKPMDNESSVDGHVPKRLEYEAVEKDERSLSDALQDLTRPEHQTDNSEIVQEDKIITPRTTNDEYLHLLKSQQTSPVSESNLSDDVYLSFSGSSDSSLYRTPQQSPRGGYREMPHISIDQLETNVVFQRDMFLNIGDLRPIFSEHLPLASKINHDSELDYSDLSLSQVSETESDKEKLKKQIEKEIAKLKSRVRSLSDSAISSDFTDIESNIMSPQSSRTREMDKFTFEPRALNRPNSTDVFFMESSKPIASSEASGKHIPDQIAFDRKSSLRDSGNICDSDDLQTWKNVTRMEPKHSQMSQHQKYLARMTGAKGFPERLIETILETGEYPFPVRQSMSSALVHLKRKPHSRLRGRRTRSTGDLADLAQAQCMKKLQNMMLDFHTGVSTASEHPAVALPYIPVEKHLQHIHKKDIENIGPSSKEITVHPTAALEYIQDVQTVTIPQTYHGVEQYMGDRQTEQKDNWAYEILSDSSELSENMESASDSSQDERSLSPGEIRLHDIDMLQSDAGSGNENLFESDEHPRVISDTSELLFKCFDSEGRPVYLDRPFSDRATKKRSPSLSDIEMEPTAAVDIKRSHSTGCVHQFDDSSISTHSSTDSITFLFFGPEDQIGQQSEIPDSLNLTGIDHVGDTSDEVSDHDTHDDDGEGVPLRSQFGINEDILPPLSGGARSLDNLPKQLDQQTSLNKSHSDSLLNLGSVVKMDDSEEESEIFPSKAVSDTSSPQSSYGSLGLEIHEISPTPESTLTIRVKEDIIAHSNQFLQDTSETSRSSDFTKETEPHAKPRVLHKTELLDEHTPVSIEQKEPRTENISDLAGNAGLMEMLQQEKLPENIVVSSDNFSSLSPSVDSQLNESQGEVQNDNTVVCVIDRTVDRADLEQYLENEITDETGGTEDIITDQLQHTISNIMADENGVDSKMVEKVHHKMASEMTGRIASEMVMGIAGETADRDSKTLTDEITDKEASEIMEGIASEMAEGIASEIADGVANINTSEITDTVTIEMVESTASEIADDITSEIADDSTSEIADDITSEIAEGIASEIAEGIASEIAEGIASEIADGIASEIANGVASEMVEGTASEMVEIIASEITDGVANRMVNEVTNRVASEIVEGIASEIVDGVANIKTSEITDKVASEIADGVANIKTSEITDNVASKMVEGIASDIADGVANRKTSEITDRVASEMVEGIASEIVDGGANRKTSEITDKVASKMVEGIASDIADGVANRKTSEITDRVASEMVEGIASDIAEGVTNRKTSEITDRIASEMVEGTASEIVDRVANRKTSEITDRVASEMVEGTASEIVDRVANRKTSEITDRIASEMVEGTASEIVDGVANIKTSEITDKVASEMVEGTASEIADRVANIKTSEITDNVASKMVEGIVSDIAEGVTNRKTSEITDRIASEMVEGTASKIVDRVANRKTSEITDKVASEIADGVANRKTSEITDRVASEIVEGIASDIAEGVTNRKTSEITDKVASEIADGVTNRKTSEITDRIASEMVEGTASEIVDRVASEMVEGIASEIASGVAYRKTSEITDKVASEMVEGIASEIASGVAYRKTSEITDKVASEMVEGIASEIADEVANRKTSEITNKVASEMVEGIASEIADEVANRKTSEITDKVASEIVDGVANRMVDEVTDRVASEMVEGIASDIVDGVANRMVDEVAGQMADDLADRIISETAERTADEIADEMMINEIENMATDIPNYVITVTDESYVFKANAPLDSRVKYVEEKHFTVVYIDEKNTSEALQSPDTDLLETNLMLQIDKPSTVEMLPESSQEFSDVSALDTEQHLSCNIEQPNAVQHISVAENTFVLQHEQLSLSTPDEAMVSLVTQSSDLKDSSTQTVQSVHDSDSQTEDRPVQLSSPVFKEADVERNVFVHGNDDENVAAPQSALEDVNRFVDERGAEYEPPYISPQVSSLSLGSSLSRRTNAETQTGYLLKHFCTRCTQTDQEVQDQDVDTTIPKPFAQTDTQTQTKVTENMYMQPEGRGQLFEEPSPMSSQSTNQYVNYKHFSDAVSQHTDSVHKEQLGKATQTEPLEERSVEKENIVREREAEGPSYATPARSALEISTEVRSETLAGTSDTGDYSVGDSQVEEPSRVPKQVTDVCVEADLPTGVDKDSQTTSESLPLPLTINKIHKKNQGCQTDICNGPTSRMNTSKMDIGGMKWQTLAIHDHQSYVDSGIGSLSDVSDGYHDYSISSSSTRAGSGWMTNSVGVQTIKENVLESAAEVEFNNIDTEFSTNASQTETELMEGASDTNDYSQTGILPGASVPSDSVYISVQSTETPDSRYIQTVTPNIEELRKEHARMMDLLERSKSSQIPKANLKLQVLSRKSSDSSTSSSTSPVTVIDRNSPKHYSDNPTDTDNFILISDIGNIEDRQHHVEENKQAESLSTQVDIAEPNTLKVGDTDIDLVVIADTGDVQHSQQYSDENIHVDSFATHIDKVELDTEVDINRYESLNSRHDSEEALLIPTVSDDAVLQSHDAMTASQTDLQRSQESQTTRRSISTSEKESGTDDESLGRIDLADQSSNFADVDDYEGSSSGYSDFSKYYVSTGVDVSVDSSDEFTQTDQDDRFQDSLLHRGRKDESSSVSSTTLVKQKKLQSDLNKLEKERIEIIKLLSLNYLPSSLTVELLEKKMNYCIGQTDMLLASIEESWDDEYDSIMSDRPRFSEITQEYISKYRSELKRDKKDIVVCLESHQRKSSGGRGRRRARNSDIIRMQRKAEIEAFRLERLREEQLYGRTRSPFKNEDSQTESPSSARPSTTDVSQFMTPQQHKSHLIKLRRNLVESSEDELQELRSRSASPLCSDISFNLRNYSFSSSSRRSSIEFSPDRSFSPEIRVSYSVPRGYTLSQRSASIESRPLQYRPHSVDVASSRHYSPDSSLLARLRQHYPTTAQILSNGVDPDRLIQESSSIRLQNRLQITQAQQSLRNLETRSKEVSSRTER